MVMTFDVFEGEVCGGFFGGKISRVNSPQETKIQPKVKTFLRTSGGIPAGPTPLARTLSEHLSPDLIWTCFGPEKGDFRSKSGQNRVQIRSGKRCSERVRARGVGPAGMALWVPKKS